MARNTIQILATVEDQASKQIAGILDAYGRSSRELPAAMEPSTQAVARLDQAVTAKSVSLVKAAGAVRSLALPIASELAPALGEASGAVITMVARTATMTSGFGLIAVAAAGVATVVGGALVASYERAKAAQANFVKALQTGDIPKLNEQLATLSETIL